MGFVGLGRMGLNMVHRMQDAGVQCVAFDTKAEAREAVAKVGAEAADRKSVV